MLAAKVDLGSRIRVLVSGALLAAGLSACGSGGGATLSRSQIVSKADSICANAQKSASALPAPTNLSDPTVAAAYFDKVAPITDTETSDLAALKPDSSVGADWSAFLSAQKAANGLLQTIKQKVDAKNRLALSDLAPVPAAGDRVRSTASKLGAATCAQ